MKLVYVFNKIMLWLRLTDIDAFNSDSQKILISIDCNFICFIWRLRESVLVKYDSQEIYYFPQGN